MSETEYLIGTSGWSYDHWKNLFYPPDLPHNKWISYYAKHLPTVELNMSFYRTPFNNMVRSWLKRTPENFVFTLKASRYITHIKRLKDICESLEKTRQLVKRFSPKAQCVLYQLPPDFKKTPETRHRLTAFLALLSDDSDQVIEFRHNSWW